MSLWLRTTGHYSASVPPGFYDVFVSAAGCLLQANRIKGAGEGRTNRDLYREAKRGRACLKGTGPRAAQNLEPIFARDFSRKNAFGIGRSSNIEVLAALGLLAARYVGNRPNPLCWNDPFPFQ
jgi:hypothetical protein